MTGMQEYYALQPKECHLKLRPFFGRLIYLQGFRQVSTINKQEMYKYHTTLRPRYLSIQILDFLH